MLKIETLRQFIDILDKQDEATQKLIYSYCVKGHFLAAAHLLEKLNAIETAP